MTAAARLSDLALRLYRLIGDWYAYAISAASASFSPSTNDVVRSALDHKTIRPDGPCSPAYGLLASALSKTGNTIHRTWDRLFRTHARPTVFHGAAICSAERWHVRLRNRLTSRFPAPTATSAAGLGDDSEHTCNCRPHLATRRAHLHSSSFPHGSDNSPAQRAPSNPVQTRYPATAPGTSKQLRAPRLAICAARSQTTRRRDWNSPGIGTAKILPDVRSNRASNGGARRRE